MDIDVEYLLATAEQEAYKAFAERLKQHKRKMKGYDLSDSFWDYAVLVEDIDNLLKEMDGVAFLRGFAAPLGYHFYFSFFASATRIEFLRFL